MDKRLRLLSDWACDTLGRPGIGVTSASADASFRRYFRLRAGDRTWIVMDAPPGREDTRSFVRAARQFRELGLNVPEILAEDNGRGFLLLTDLGDATYLSCLNAENAEELYEDALRALVLLQTGTIVNRDFFPAYDESLLRGEMELFREWYVPRHLGTTLTADENQVVERSFELLVDRALEQPQVWVHRDYHSRNLMQTEVENPGVLDFQDAVLGPVSYDLVSLLKDCYVEWPAARVDRWVERYRALASAAGVDTGDSETFNEWFHLMGAQRHIKVLGIFSRLYYRDDKQHYLDDIPLVRKYLVDACARLPDLRPLGEVLDALQRRVA